MKYFQIETIKESIERLQHVSANWLIPAFVFAANDVGLDDLIDMSRRLGTDQFLDRYFHGQLVGLPNTERGNNLLRPRLKGIVWNRGQFAQDYVIRQDTKMWGNLFSSRGYREMRLEGIIEGNGAIVRLTAAFQPRLEAEIPDTFRFEDFLVWLFAFRGFPDTINGWDDLNNYLLQEHLDLTQFKAPYQGRFSLSSPSPIWPALITQRPSNEIYLSELAPKLQAYLSELPLHPGAEQKAESMLPQLGNDDLVWATVQAAVSKRESYAFLLAGPPGTGKTRYARQLAMMLTESTQDRLLFLQFHPAISYDDFIEGFRPQLSLGGAGIQYDLSPRLFLEFSHRAANDRKNRYVVVIDELNRGDVARIFGEVLTYLEPDYRNMEFTLPFSGKRTSLPPNLIVIATANPYDRSVTDLDDALLRRFLVIEFEPDRAVLENHLQASGVDQAITRRALHMFDALNRAFPNGFGHSNFLNVRSVDDLSAMWIGRVRLALRRALVHDRGGFDTIATEVEALLKTKEDSSSEDDA